MRTCAWLAAGLIVLAACGADDPAEPEPTTTSTTRPPSTTTTTIPDQPMATRGSTTKWGFAVSVIQIARSGDQIRATFRIKNVTAGDLPTPDLELRCATAPTKRLPLEVDGSDWAGGDVRFPRTFDERTALFDSTNCAPATLRMVARHRDAGDNPALAFEVP